MTDNAVHVSPIATTKAPTAVPDAPKEAGFGIRHKRSYLLAIGIGFVMAIIAPLQTDHIPVLPRMVYWQILMVSGATLGLGVTELVERWGRLRKWPWAEVPLIGILIALPLTMIVMGAGAMFFGTQSSGVFRFGYNFAITALISVAITALGHMINGDKPVVAQAPAQASAAATTAEPIPTNRFAERLPLPLRSLPIVALQAEDHYLRVHLADGQSALILMRLSDAIAELPAEIGKQTHRSWWVAKNAVRATSKSDGRATLMLDHAIEAPVSRSYYKALGDGGWLT
jgi:hypothetical protein